MRDYMLLMRYDEGYRTSRQPPDRKTMSDGKRGEKLLLWGVRWGKCRLYECSWRSRGMQIVCLGQDSRIRKFHRGVLVGGMILRSTPHRLLLWRGWQHPERDLL